MSRRRVKRASVQDLYANCRLGGDCPSDVKNKVEGNTLADRLLKWFGSFIYLGNLGIGTGKGSGGMTGYTPIAGVTGPKTTTEIAVTRPVVPIDPLGGAEGIPLDVINPTDSSIVTLSEGGLPDPTLVEVTVAGADKPAEIDITSPNPFDSTSSSSTHPTVIHSGEDIPLVDFQPGPPPPKRVALDVGYRPSNAVQINAVPETSFIDPDINIYVDPNFSGDVVGWGEEVPLREEFELAENAEGPLTSTPNEPRPTVFGRATARARDLYNRYVLQQPTRNVDFLGRPSRAVTFEFENPAFSPDVTIEFQNDLNEVRAAPDPDFRDIITLGRARYSETPEGTVRISRLGQRGSMTTRSGLQIGQRVHFYYDISDIPPAESIELRSLGETSHTEVSVAADTESAFVDALENLSNHYSDEALLDEYNETFENSHLIITSTDILGETLDMPTIPPGIATKFIVTDAGDLFVHYPLQPDTTVISSIPIIPLDYTQPLDDLIYTGDSFDLHPSLKRRKRKYVDLF